MVDVLIDQEVVVAEVVLIIIWFLIIGLHPMNKSFDRRVVLSTRVVVRVL